MTDAPDRNNPCLYLPGRGQTNAEGTGALLRGMGLDVSGPDLDLAFCARPFAGQVEDVARPLREALAESAPLVAKSYGAYLLLHALLRLEEDGTGPESTGRSTTYLLAPVTGSPPLRLTAEGVTASRLPRNGLLERAAASGRFPFPGHFFLHVGVDDQLLPPAETFAELAGEHCTLVRVPGKGHRLGREYERRALAALGETVD